MLRQNAIGQFGCPRGCPPNPKTHPDNERGLWLLTHERLRHTPRIRAVLDFLYERLRGYLRDRGYTANQVAAVVDSRPDCIDDLPERLEAVRAFEALPEALSLSAANKRIVNILRKAQGEGGGAVDLSVLVDGAERALHAAFDQLRPIVASRVADGDFSAALRALASTKPTVDRFFDDVMVMADDPKIRGNRLALLREVSATMNHVADISKLAV